MVCPGWCRLDWKDPNEDVRGPGAKAGLAPSHSPLPGPTLGDYEATQSEILNNASGTIPHGILRHGDSGELARKVNRLKESLAESEMEAQNTVLNLNSWKFKGVSVEEVYAPIFKRDVKRRLVYSVIAESGMVDSQGDVMNAQTIEDMAHNFMMRFRSFDERHDWKPVDALPVESWVFKEDVTLYGQLIKAVSWVIGVKVFDDRIWQKVEGGLYKGFSIGGRGVRTPRVRFT